MAEAINKTALNGMKRSKGNREAASRALKRSDSASESDRRSLILAAATKLFSINGYAGTTVRSISDEVGLLSGSLYHYFSSKDEMFDEIIRRYVFDKRELVVSKFRSGGGFLDTISSMATLQLTHVMSNKVVSGIILDEVRMLGGSDRYEFVVKADIDIFNAWREVIKRAVREGKLHSEVDCCLMASTIMVIIDNATRLIVESDRADEFQRCGSEDHIIDQVSAMIFGMISPWAK